MKPIITRDQLYGTVYVHSEAILFDFPPEAKWKRFAMRLRSAWEIIQIALMISGSVLCFAFAELSMQRLADSHVKSCAVEKTNVRLPSENSKNITLAAE